MTSEALHCPSCGAPAPMPAANALWLCVYCNSLIRVRGAPAQANAAVEATLPADLMGEVKQLLLHGQREQAIQRFQQGSGASPADAQPTINALAQELSLRTLSRQQLSGFGAAMVVLSLLAIVALGLIVRAGMLHPLGAAAGMLCPASLLLIFGPALLTSLRYLSAPTAVATIRRAAYIGEARVRNGPIHTYRLLVEAQPAQGPPFEAELALPVRDANRHLVQEGTKFQVKYRPGDPGSVIFDRRLN
jgi:hypothetical protein